MEIKLPIRSEAEKQIEKWMPECYFGNDYPREGCVVVLEVGESVVRFRSYAPNGKILEVGPTLPRNVAGLGVQEWLDGLMPGKSRAS